jgi:thiol-disulfide isomerase/thioredoxin
LSASPARGLETVRESPPTLPRWIAAIFIGAIALASLAALVWPTLPFGRVDGGATNVGVVRRQIDDSAAAGRVGAPAPDFEWNAPEGRVLRLSDHRGKVVVVNFWATWCVPCRQEMPALERVARSSDIVVVEVDLQENGEKVRSFFDQLALERLVPVLDTDGATTRRYGVLSLPSTFFIDPSGVIRHVELGGPLSEQQIRQGVAKAR